MAAEPVDISGLPEVAKLAEEVRRTGTPRMLKSDGKDVALLTPIPTARRTGGPAPRRKRGRIPSTADLEAFFSTAGGWKDVDTDRLVDEIYASRRASSRPPVEL